MVRGIEPNDAEAIREIYNHEVRGSVATLDLVPRSREAQDQWMQEHSGIHTALVCVSEGVVIGFASLSPYRPRPGYSSTVENSIYVHRDARRLGVGRLLLTGLLNSAATLGFHSCMARVVATQSASLELHRSCGFQLVGIEQEVGRKFGQWIDIALMQCMLTRARRSTTIS
ncbi:MAG: GNAT family N-acetyltransferase [Acidimicrobiales bacterium]